MHNFKIMTSMTGWKGIVSYTFY